MASKASARTGGRIAAARWVLLGILLLAVGLRLYGLSGWPVEQDELYTLRDARAFGEYINPLRPLYFALQRLLLEVLPATPLFLRLPAFLFGVLGVWLTWELGRKTFGGQAGLIAAFLVAISPWHVFYSQYARYWSLVYLLAAFLYLQLPRALDRDRPIGYLLVLLITVAGILTHLTFAFPLPGVFLAVLLVSREGRVAWRWPSRRAWQFLWGPLVITAVTGFLYMLLRGSFSGLSGTRGLNAGLRLVPAMVQWANPVILTAAVVGLAHQLFGTRAEDRRWGSMAAAGCLTGVGFLVVIAFRLSVYADYAMAALPLVFVSVGGLLQRVSEALHKGSRSFLAGATLVLTAAVLPGLVSHLSDGTRFDYRPAYAYIELGWPAAVQQYYAPNLRFRPLRLTPEYLDQTLQDTSGFWLVGSYRRYGMAWDRGGARWVTYHCRQVLQTQRPRLDYRSYRVELHWCGPRPPPAPQ
jgi:4-amino-4-deoxy-L-arabinose transferase-like glycosyltransferase